VYNAKVQTVKDEHEQLLQQAFERAKVRFHIDVVVQLSLLCRMKQVTSIVKTSRLSERSPRGLPNSFVLRTKLLSTGSRLSMKPSSPPSRRPSRSRCPSRHSS
jgi:hypothetical protein